MFLMVSNFRKARIVVRVRGLPLLLLLLVRAQAQLFLLLLAGVAPCGFVNKGGHLDNCRDLLFYRR